MDQVCFCWESLGLFEWKSPCLGAAGPEQTADCTVWQEAACSAAMFSVRKVHRVLSMYSDSDTGPVQPLRLLSAGAVLRGHQRDLTPSDVTIVT